MSYKQVVSWNKFGDHVELKDGSNNIVGMLGLDYVINEFIQIRKEQAEQCL